MNEDRCTGHCCRCFWLPYDYHTFEEKAKLGELQEGLQIFSMLTPLELSTHPPECVEAKHANQPVTTGAYYTCKNVLPSGDCAIYNDRPKMCSDYPHYASDGKCKYSDCTWNQVKAGGVGDAK